MTLSNSSTQDAEFILRKYLCLSHFPSPTVERHSQPAIEVSGPECHSLLPPVTVAYGPNQTLFIEPAVNSLRINLRLRKHDDLERLLCHKFTCFMMQRAESFKVLRRKAVEGYDISFLIVDQHLLDFSLKGLVHFIKVFLDETGRELNCMKIGVNSRARNVAEAFFSEFI